MSSQADIRVVVAFLPDRVSYRVERDGDLFSSSGVMRPSPESLSGRGLMFDFESVALAPNADLQARLLHGSLDLQTRLGSTPDLLGDAAEPAIVAFIEGLMGSVFRSSGSTQVTLSTVGVSHAN